MKKSKRICLGLLSLLIIAALFQIPKMTAHADDNVYDVKADDAITALQEQVDAGKSLHFAKGSYSYDGTLLISKDIVLTTDAGADVTFTPADGKNGMEVSGTGSIKFDGSGSITVDGKNTNGGDAIRGINCGGRFIMAGGTLNVKNTAGYGIGGDAIGSDFNMTGGTLNITNCGHGDRADSSGTITNVISQPEN